MFLCKEIDYVGTFTEKKEKMWYNESNKYNTKEVFL